MPMQVQQRKEAWTVVVMSVFIYRARYALNNEHNLETKYLHVLLNLNSLLRKRKRPPWATTEGCTLSYHLTSWHTETVLKDGTGRAFTSSALNFGSTSVTDSLQGTSFLMLILHKASESRFCTMSKKPITTYFHTRYPSDFHAIHHLYCFTDRQRTGDGTHIDVRRTQTD